MPNASISHGTAHALPADMEAALRSRRVVLGAWEELTPLARNEWICWVTFVKKAETRAEHVERMIRQLREGKRRPCCWIGCVHRKDKAVSPSVKAILARQYRVTQETVLDRP